MKPDKEFLFNSLAFILMVPVTFLLGVASLIAHTKIFVVAMAGACLVGIGCNAVSFYYKVIRKIGER